MKSKMNRLANAQNPYQGDMKRVLCVCSAGLLRSPTIAWVLSNPPYNCNTRAAGVSQDYALIPIDDALIHWADEIVCADEEHARPITELIKENNFLAKEKPIHILSIEDKYKTRSPELVKIVEAELERVKFPRQDVK